LLVFFHFDCFIKLPVSWIWWREKEPGVKTRLFLCQLEECRPVDNQSVALIAAPFLIAFLLQLQVIARVVENHARFKLPRFALPQQRGLDAPFEQAERLELCRRSIARRLRRVAVSTTRPCLSSAAVAVRLSLAFVFFPRSAFYAHLMRASASLLGFLRPSRRV
jgi:hypothetical protein